MMQVRAISTRMRVGLLQLFVIELPEDGTLVPKHVGVGP